MKFALLGDDPAVQPLLEAIAGSPEHHLSHILSPGDDTSSDADSRFVAAARIVRGWDELLGEPVDVFLVAGADENVLEAAAQLAADGRRLAIFPNAAQPAEWVYALMLTDDADRLLVPVFAHRVHPPVQRSRELTRDGSLGKILHLHLERQCRVFAAAGGPALLSRADMDSALLADMDLLRLLGGDYNRVTATFHGNDKWFSASVTLAGEVLPDALWRLEPSTEKIAWRLGVVGERGRIELSGDAAQGVAIRGFTPPARLEVNDDDGTFDEGTAILEQLEAAARGEPTVFGGWNDLVRDVDLLAAAHRSARRGRTIDVHFETTSERSQFKTQMTAVGCGVLFLTLIGIVIVLVAGAALDPRSTTEIAADAAGSIVYVEEFESNSGKLTSAGREHVSEIAGRAEGPSERPFPILVEEGSGGDGQWNEVRRQEVAELLESAGIDGANRRTASAPLRGTEFNTAMRVARIAVWVPLLLFLLLQVLLFVARPAPESTPAGALPEVRSASGDD